MLTREKYYLKIELYQIYHRNYIIYIFPILLLNFQVVVYYISYLTSPFHPITNICLYGLEFPTFFIAQSMYLSHFHISKEEVYHVFSLFLKKQTACKSTLRRHNWPYGSVLLSQRNKMLRNSTLSIYNNQNIYMCFITTDLPRTLPSVLASIIARLAKLCKVTKSLSFMHYTVSAFTHIQKIPKETNLLCRVCSSYTHRNVY